MTTLSSYSRHKRALSPAITPSSSTPSRLSSASRASSPSSHSPSSYVSTVTPFNQSKVNIVTKLAIEGKAKKSGDPLIKMYLKLSLPLASATEGSTIPLFPEENIKIVNSMVHPLDKKGAPYLFESNVRLLRHAARALNLPARSSKDFRSEHGLPVPSSSPSSSSSSPPMVNEQPVDPVYVGQIIVSGYQICYVVPKEHPTVQQGHSHASFGSRRSSFGGEKNHIQFMAAIDMVIPYGSRPPRAPYLLSIPTPRCLQNNIKLGLFPPGSATSASLASLSSMDEEAGSWDLTADPVVAHPIARSTSYNHLADDESSESSSTGFYDGCGLQGTFPSTEHLHIRWAKPVKTLDIPTGATDGRRRVGVKESRGEMKCVVRGKMKDPDREGQEGVLMDIEYQGTCKGVWFSGAATALGMDVSLEAKGSDISWAEGFPDLWTVIGEKGYTGFDAGTRSRAGSISRHDSMDSNSPFLSPGDTPGRGSSAPGLSRQNSTSLLRAPLPNQNVAEYSFEGSPSSSQATSSVSTSLSTLPSTPNLGPSLTPGGRLPGAPITLYLNMNQLLPAGKVPFVFKISGTVLVTPRQTLPRPNGATPKPQPRGHDSRINGIDSDLEVIVPRFTVLAADNEKTSIVVHNSIDTGNTDVEVYNPNGSRKALLERGGYTNDARERDKIALRPMIREFPSQSGFNLPSSMLQTPVRPKTPNDLSSRAASPAILGDRVHFPSRPRRDGPLMIPRAKATVMPFLTSEIAYTVGLSLSAPADDPSDVLEFGLAQPPNEQPLKVDIVSVSIDGVPVKHNVSAAAKPDEGEQNDGIQMGGKDWVAWVQVHLGGMGGGQLIIDYIVKNKTRESRRKGKEKTKYGLPTKVLLPTFSLPVGSLEVTIQGSSDVDISIVDTNLVHQRLLNRVRELKHYSLPEYFDPVLTFSCKPPRSQLTFGLPLLLITLLAYFTAFLYMFHLHCEVTRLGKTLERHYGVQWDSLPRPETFPSSYSDSKWADLFEELPEAETTTSVSSESAPTETTTETQSLSPMLEETKAVSLHTALSSTYMNSLAAIPATITSLTWEDLRPFRKVATATIDQASRALSFAWWLFNRAWTFPSGP